MTDRKSFVHLRDGFKHVYTLQEGEQWAFFQGHLIVVHPEREPKIVDKHGNVTILKLK